MDDGDLARRIDELDAALSKEGAQLVIYQEEEETHCELIANRNGYLRAGVEMLRAAVVPLNKNQFITPLDVNYLIGERSLIVKRLVRNEDINAMLPPIGKQGWKTNVIGIGCVVFLFSAAICALVGFGDIISWLFKK